MTCKRCEGNEHGHRLIAMIHNCERPISAITAPCSCMKAADYKIDPNAPRKLGKTGSSDASFVNEAYRRNAEVQKKRRSFKIVVDNTSPE